jgi:hypothetical protein
VVNFLVRSTMLVRLHARGDDAQQVIVGAAHRVALQNLGSLADELVESAHGIGMMILQRDHGVGEYGQPDGVRPQERRVPGNESGLLEPPQTPPARRRRQADPLGQLLIGDTRIVLQLLEDAAVESIEGALRHRRSFRSRGAAKIRCPEQ